jgi:TolB-like protein/DNA-binding winged helix-turn-helix (wHTH) protein
MAKTPTPNRLQFGPFLADFQACELRKNGRKIHLQEKPMLLLGALAAKPGEVVSREELQKQLWPDDTFVDFETGLNAVVRKLREALADNPENPRYIETIPKRGYRFLGQVDSKGITEPSVSSGQDSPNVELTSTSQGRRTIASLVETLSEYRRAKHVWMIVAAALALGGLALTIVELNVLKVAGLHERAFGASGAPAIHSIAVLPLQNLSADSGQEYFSDGMTDALITDFAQIGSLKVISRTSSMQYKQTKKSLPEIAHELNVDGIVEGTVQRSGNRVRITAQLIHGPSDKHLWAQSYERDMQDVFALERDVTEDIARHVQERLSQANSVSLSQPRHVDGKALEAYLQGNYHLNQYGQGAGDEEKRTAAGYFQQVIDADPNFAPAYNGLANSHLNLLWPSNQDAEIAREAAERAVALDPNLSDAHCTLAGINFAMWNWPRAEEEFRRAIALNPNNALARDHFGDFLDAIGRMDEGWRESQIAQELDPSYDHLSDRLARRGQDDQAIAMIQLMLQRNPDDGYEHVALCKEYLRKGLYQEATIELEQVAILFGFPQTAAQSRRARAVSDYRGALRELLKGWVHLWATHQAFLPINFAEVETTLGDKDRAFYWLEQAYAHHDIEIASTDVGLEMLNTDFLLNPLRSDPRFKDLLGRVGLPDIPVSNSVASGRQTDYRQ